MAEEQTQPVEQTQELNNNNHRKMFHMKRKKQQLLNLVLDQNIYLKNFGIQIKAKLIWKNLVSLIRTLKSM